MTDITSIGDIGTPEQHARGLLRKVIRGGKVIAERRRTSTHNTMYFRKQLSEDQYLAAEKLWETHKGAEGYNNCEARERTNGGKQNYMVDTQLDCIDAYNRAISKLETLEMTLVVHVVLNDKSPTSRKMTSTTRREKMKTLKYGLNKLAKHYGFQ